MRHTVIVSLTLLLSMGSLPMQGTAKTNGVESIKIHGYVGGRIDDCIKYRVKAQDVNELTDVFALHEETSRWGSEFWGKWVQGAIASYQYNHDPELYRIIRQSVKDMISHQLPNGYLGNYSTGAQLTNWDVWGRKYTTLGLLKWYLLSGDKAALRGACRLIDYTMTQIGPKGKHIYETGLYRGLPPSSILEPVMLLYQTTHQQKYLDWAKWIVQDDETAHGPQLIAKADVPVAQRSPLRSGEVWWSFNNGQKAYEMMSCYVGLLELYRVTGETCYLKAVQAAVKHIEQEEINICGSGSAMECWYGGQALQTRPTLHSMETCVGFTWMQINERLLGLTHDAHYMDNIEQTFYNAILAAMKDDGSQIAKYTPLEGFRIQGEQQCGLHINCCNANGPRAFALIPRVMYQMPDAHRIEVNFYAPSTAKLRIEGHEVSLVQETTYPIDSVMKLKLNADRPIRLAIALRIPVWSQKTQVSVNGIPQAGVKPGAYYIIDRQWKSNDRIELTLDMRGRVSQLNGKIAVQRGPITLARDSRMDDGDVDECVDLRPVDGYVSLTPIQPQNGMWMTFELPARVGTDRENAGYKRPIRFCDFASAGSQWDRNSRYTVWLTEPLDPKTMPRK